MTRHILLLCLLGNPFELNLGGHQRTVLEIIEHFKDMPRLEITVITTTKSSLKQLTPSRRIFPYRETAPAPEQP